MQNMYVGDIGDYGKYGLLRALLPTNNKLGIYGMGLSQPNSELLASLKVTMERYSGRRSYFMPILWLPRN